MVNDALQWVDTGGIIALALWALKVAFSAGKVVEGQVALEKRVDELRVDLAGRLEHIERLLMERKP